MARIRRIVPRNLFQRAFLLIVIPLVVAQAVVAAVFFLRYWSETTARLSDAAATDIALLLGVWDAAEDPMMHALSQKARAAAGVALSYRAEPPPRRPARRSNLPILDAPLTRALEHRLARPFTVDTVRHPRLVEVRVDLTPGEARILIPKDRLEARHGGVFLFWMLTASLAVAAVAAIFLRNQVKPARRLADAAEAFGKGREVADFKPTGATELRRAAQAFLLMRGRINRHIAQRTALLAGVGHDLRTPITRLKLELAIAGDGEPFDAMRRDVAEMERLLEDYLDFARGQAEAELKPLDLAGLLRRVADEMEGEAGAPKSVRYEGPDALEARARPVPIARAVRNLLENAVRHGDHARLTLSATTDQATILVDDDGPGLSADLRREAMRPFTQLSENGGSSGLGLAIARDIARAHGGDLRLENAPLGGLRARFVLPR